MPSEIYIHIWCVIGNQFSFISGSRFMNIIFVNLCASSCSKVFTIGKNYFYVGEKPFKRISHSTCIL